VAVGKSLKRIDGEDKITGKALYVDDMNFPGELLGHVVRSPYPCANIKAIHKDDLFDWKKAVTFTAHEIPGENVLNNFNMDVPFLPKNGRVNYAGEPVMLLAAVDRETLEEAVNHIHVEYEELPAALTIDEALAGRQIIYGDDNILKTYEINKGDCREGFAKARHVIEGTYETGHQEHAYIEPQGVVAVPDDDGEGVTIYGSMQCPYYVRLEAQRLFTFAPEKIRVIQTTTGGGFGGKEHFPSVLAGHAALLALKAKKPVRMIYGREEDMESSTKRHPSRISIRTGIDDQGMVTAIDVDITFDGGAYSMATPVVLARGTIAGAGAYHAPHVKIRSRALATNTVPASAFRGFGAPQVFYAMELHMNRAAGAIGLDPYTFRMKNLLREGDRTATGQLLRYSVGLGECMEAAEKKSNFLKLFQEYEKQPKDARKRKGIGIAAVFHGAGFTGKGEDRIKAKAGLHFLPGGAVRILCSTTEMGQGMRTILPQIVAEALQVNVDTVSVEVTDTLLVPDSGPTVASRTTMIVGKVLRDVSLQALETFKEEIALKRGIDARVIEYSRGTFEHGGKWCGDLNEAIDLMEKKGHELKFYSQYSHPPFITWDEVKFEGDAYAGYGWAVTVAEVEVDLETFEVTPKRLVSAHDMGKAINPLLVEGQIEGGTIQAFGYALMEELKFKEGRLQTKNLTTYIIPTALDVPAMETILVESEYPYGPYGAKGIGETPLVSPGGAIASAVRQATGLEIHEIPITPEKLFALSRKGR